MPYNAAEAIGYGWSKFVENLGSMLLITLGLMILPSVIDQISNLITGSGSLISSGLSNCDPTSGNFVDCVLSQSPGTGTGVAMLVLSVGSSIVSLTVSVLLQAALYKGALLIVDGHQPSLGDMILGWDKLKMFGTVILVALITIVGVLLCVLPGIIAAFLLMFAPLLAVDNQGGSITDPLKRSFEMVKNNVGQLILLVILCFFVTILGFLACCVGLLAAVPTITIAQAYSVRRLEGRPVAG